MSSLLKRKHLLAASKSADPSAAYQSRVIADGAVAYWPLDEVSGTVANDKVGTRHGTISGGVTLNQPGVAGSKSMAFDGVSTTKITLPSVPSFLPIFSHEIWLNTRTISGFHAMLARITDRTFNNQMSGANLVLGIPGIANFGNVTIPALTWTYVVWRWDGTTITMYLNGVSRYTNSASIPSDTGVGSGLIGNGDSFGTPFPWDGFLQDIAVYSKALSPAEISAHFALR